MSIEGMSVNYRGLHIINATTTTTTTPPPVEEIDPNKEANQESVKMKLEYEALCKQFQEMMESYKKKMELASVKLEDTKPSSPATTASKPKEGNVVSLVVVKTALRRDF